MVSKPKGTDTDNTTDDNTDDTDDTENNYSVPTLKRQESIKLGLLPPDKKVSPKKRRGSAFFKKRLPKQLYAMPEEADFWNADLNMAGPEEIPIECIPLCRYKNILPNSKTVVKLDAVEGLEGEEQMLARFINANYIKGADGTAPKRYIATQGPKPNTIDHFWRMVWEHKTSLIVMVTGVTEGGRVKCHAYWPSQKGETMYITTNTNISVANRGTTEDQGVRTTKLEVEMDDVVREVTHVQYIDWPDQSVPKSVRDIAISLNEVRQHSTKEAPIVVHCSAGVGRTGVIIACDMAIDMIEAEQPTDLFEIMLNMRNDRGCMIQTYEQLALTYRIVGRYLKNNPKSDDNESTTSPRPRSSSPRPSPAFQKAVLEESLTRATEAHQPYGHDYTHRSQQEVEEIEDDAIPTWRLNIKTEKTQELDAAMAEEPDARASTRYFEKRKSEMNRRNSAEMLINKIEKLDEDALAEGIAKGASTKELLAPAKKPKPTRRMSFIGRRKSTVIKLGNESTTTKTPPKKPKTRRMSVRNAITAVSKFIGSTQDNNKLSEKEEDEDADYDPDTLEDSAETISFLSTLQSNRAEREKEEEMRKKELADEFKARKVEYDRLRSIEIAKIEKQQEQEKLDKEAEKDKHVVDSMTRMEGITFDFTFG